MFLLTVHRVVRPSDDAILFATSYPGSSFPLTSGRETSDPGKIRFESPKISDFRLNCACLGFREFVRVLFYFRLFELFEKANQNRQPIGSFESLSFRQACAVRSEDSRDENEVSFLQHGEYKEKRPLLTGIALGFRCRLKSALGFS